MKAAENSVNFLLLFSLAFEVLLTVYKLLVFLNRLQFSISPSASFNTAFQCVFVSVFLCRFSSSPQVGTPLLSALWARAEPVII